jgi:hypothetical protein
MKSSFYHFYIAILLVAIVACEKKTDEPSSLPPHIEGVTFLNDRNQFQDSVLFGEWILIKGKYLSTAHSVSFSDVAIEAKDFFADDTSIAVKIPASLPDPTTNPIKVITSFGDVTYQYKIVLPPPVIHSVDKLAANADELITITGDFFLFLSEVKIGNFTAEIVEFDRYSVKVKNPDTYASGAISVTTPRGTSVSNKIFGFKYIVFDEEVNADFIASPYGHNSYEVAYTDETRRGSTAFFIDYKAGSWGSSRFSRTAAAGSMDLTGYSGVKFSYYCMGPSTNSRLRVVIGASGLTIDCETGKWVDVAIPFTSLGNPTSLTALEIKEFRGQGVLYVLDDIGFY